MVTLELYLNRSSYQMCGVTTVTGSETLVPVIGDERSSNKFGSNVGYSYFLYPTLFSK